MSTTSVSLENRASIRPVGVTSKKLFGKRRIFAKTRLCNCTAAYQQPSLGSKSTKNEVKAEKKTKFGKKNKKLMPKIRFNPSPIDQFRFKELCSTFSLFF